MTKDQVIDFTNADQMSALVTAIIHQENGRVNYTAAQIGTGVAMVLAPLTV